MCPIFVNKYLCNLRTKKDCYQKMLLFFIPILCHLPHPLHLTCTLTYYKMNNTCSGNVISILLLLNTVTLNSLFCTRALRASFALALYFVSQTATLSTKLRPQLVVVSVFSLIVCTVMTRTVPLVVLLCFDVVWNKMSNTCPLFYGGIKIKPELS